MERIITEITEKLKRDFTIFFAGTQTDVGSAETYFSKRIAEATVELLQAYYEEQDQKLREDKAGRKEAGLSVERRGDKREVLTLLGRLEYRRTYYKKASGGYEYPADRLAGVDAYERISDGVGLALVETSCKVSYERASEYNRFRAAQRSAPPCAGPGVAAVFPKWQERIRPPALIWRQTACQSDCLRELKTC